MRNVARKRAVHLLAHGRVTGPIAKRARQHIVVHVGDLLAAGRRQIEAVLALEARLHAVLGFRCQHHAEFRRFRQPLATSGNAARNDAPRAVVARRRRHRGDRELVVVLAHDVQCGAVLHLVRDGAERGRHKGGRYVGIHFHVHRYDRSLGYGGHHAWGWVMVDNMAVSIF